MSDHEISRPDIVHDNTLDLIALNNALNDLRVGINSLQQQASRIERQTTMTNGRVTALELWRIATEKAGAYAAGFRAGQFAILGAIVTVGGIVGGGVVKLIGG